MRRGVRVETIASGSGVVTVACWGAAAGLMLARTRLATSFVPRPDRWFGGDGAAYWPLLTAFAIASAIALGSFGAALARTVATTDAAPTRPERVSAARVLAVATGLLLAAAGVSYAAVSLFPPDAGLYVPSPLRGAGALGFVVAISAAELLAGAGLVATGRVAAGAASFVVGAVSIWQAFATGVAGALAGAAQPQLDAFVPVQAIAAAWILGLSVWLLLFAQRTHGGETLSAASTAVRPPHPRFAVALVMAGVVVALAGGGIAYPTVAGGLGPQLAGRTTVQTLRIGGLDRTFRVYRPARIAVRPGLVVALHGVMGSGFQFERSSGLDAEADRLGWIVAYPDGVSDGWWAFGATSYWGLHPGAEDVPFLAAIIDRILASDEVDPGAVFVTGMSRGGMMTHRAGCELAGRLAAIAPVAGNMATSSGNAADVPCRPERPLSVLAVHGTGDTVIPFGGGHVDIDFAPFEDVMAKWRAVDACGGAASVSRESPVTTSTWQCADGTTVASRVIDGGGHSWPDGIARVVVDFFGAHRRR